MSNSVNTPLFHSSKPLSKTWLNRIFSIIYTLAVSVHMLRHLRTLIYSPTPIRFALFLADFVLAFLWLIAQCFHWNPIERKVYIENLKEVIKENEYPPLDVVICTADPIKEPPVGVVNTALSVLAYEYPTEKLSVYVSDDGGSDITLYAFMECAKFAKYWIPYCKKHNIVDRAPQVYFESDYAVFNETDELKAMYESMKLRVETVVQSGGLCSEQRTKSEIRDAFRQWTPDFTRRQHPSVIQILLDNNADKDVVGGVMPNLIYVSREKSVDVPHHFKAGALNAMLRVSRLMTNAPIVLVLDCDMYSNDPETPLRALCYFLDPNVDPKLAFVQFPQRFRCINKDDIYASEFRPETGILFQGMDGLLGGQFMGTGGFLIRRVISDGTPHVISGDDTRGNDSKLIKSEDALISVYEVASCTFEDDTKWGSEIGFRYGSLAEDTYTSYRLHCEGWKSIICNPKRAAFLGGAPSTLNDALTQIKRWYMGFLEISFSKYCPLIYGTRSMNPLQALCYSHYTFRSFWSIPVLIYAFLPQISLLNSFPIFTKVSDDRFSLYAFLFLGAYLKDFLDFLFGGGSVQRWWNQQRMWLMWGLSSHPFALFEWSLKSLNLSTFGFNVTSKVVDEEQNIRYDQGVFEFGVESELFYPITVASLINLISFVYGIMVVSVNGRLDEFFVQVFISGFGVVNSWPVYEGTVLRKDLGKMPLKITIASIVIAIVICFISSLVY
ncbi:cellulose synthase-like protein G3 [Rutidosis leptorrhynchoides]|uniref:cellulose synthase-like protein G3 n=1 Tax=Rutidosis leptorrhynchoides TaxID=125765 RepID=UPI003A994F1F